MSVPRIIVSDTFTAVNATVLTTTRQNSESPKICL
jgi:hypothetical protein